MIVLGLDLSITRTGWCLVDNSPERFNSPNEVDILFGTITTKPRHCLEQRLFDIQIGITGIQRGNTLADIAVIEEPIQHRHHKSGQMSLHALYGVVRLMLYENGIKVEWVHPKTLKKVTTGNGNASKEAMMRAVKVRWNVKVKDDNEADAVALAMYGLDIAKEWASIGSKQALRTPQGR